MKNIIIMRELMISCYFSTLPSWSIIRLISEILTNYEEMSLITLTGFVLFMRICNFHI